jgi:Tfp pilus assembly protein PilV
MKLRRNPALKSGFTLIETCISVCIFAIAFAALHCGLSYCFTMVQTSRDTERSTQIMLDQMERIRLLTWTQLTNETFYPRQFTTYSDVSEDHQGAVERTGKGTEFKGAISVIAPSAAMLEGSPLYSEDLRLVTIRLRWKQGRMEKDREMATLVSRNGMQRYVFSRNQ